MMYTCVPRAHHRAVLSWRDIRLRLVESTLALLARGSRPDTGLTIFATEEGHGSGTLERCKYDVSEEMYTKSYAPAAMEGALSQVCWT